MKVGDYVRTKDGRIEKYSGTDDSAIENFALSDIIKSSPNIIDLIEVGDYVNGVWVDEIKDGRPYHEDYNDPYYSYYLDEDEIYSIVTKEQFESMEYKVKE